MAAWLVAGGVATGAAAAPAPARLVAATLSPDASSVRLVFRGGGTRTVASDDAGASFGPPRLSRDGRMAGWTELRGDGGSYAAPVGVVVYRGGRVRHLGCDAGAPSVWRFGRGSRVVLTCAFPHGPEHTAIEVTDVATGRRVAAASGREP